MDTDLTGARPASWEMLMLHPLKTAGKESWLCSVKQTAGFLLQPLVIELVEGSPQDIGFGLHT